jgi:putative ABC transport system substrate-binding protein
MIDRRMFIAMSAIAILVAPLVGEGQPAGKVPRVGFLVMARNLGVEEAFPRGLRDLGYVEGRDIVIEWRSAEGRNDRMPGLAAQLIQLGVDIIVAGGPEARQEAMKATSTTPIVVVGGSDPVDEGWAVSLARPGGNVTGFTVTHPEMSAKKLELLKEMIPGLSRVAVIWDPGRARSPSTQRTSMRTAARSLGLDLQFIEVRQPADLEGAFRQALRDRRQAVSVVETAMVFAHRTEIAERARKDRLPTIGEWKLSASAGFLVSYGTDLSDLLRRAATYVDKILKGAKPGDLPVEQPTKFELVINLKTAKALGLTIPQTVLGRADQVIE